MTQLPEDHPRSDRPNLLQKKKLAKELLKATRRLDKQQASRFLWNHPRFRGKTALDVIHSDVGLAEAQQVVAMESGFDSWPRLVEYVRLLDTEPDGPVAVFEDVVHAMIRGSAGSLRQLLSDHPQVATMQSPRRHRSYLPHYLAANGVENEHQITPPNVIEIADILFEHGGDQVIDAPTETGPGGAASTPLVALVTSVHPHQAGVQARLVQAFCQAGAQMNGLDDDGLPLTMALGFHYPKAAIAMVECGARIDNLPAAAGVGHVEQVRDFLDPASGLISKACMFPNPSHDPFPDSTPPHPTETMQQAFVFACMGGHLDVARVLRKHDVDVNGSPRRGVTALHEASYQGHLHVVRFLLEQNADPVQRDEFWNSTAIGWASGGNQPEVIQELFSNGRVDILDAIELKRLDVVRDLLAADPSLADAPNGSGGVLRYAAGQGDFELAQLLLANGACADLRDEANLTAVDHANRAGHPPMVRLLQEANNNR